MSKIQKYMPVLLVQGLASLAAEAREPIDRIKAPTKARLVVLLHSSVPAMLADLSMAGVSSVRQDLLSVLVPRRLHYVVPSLGR